MSLESVSSQLLTFRRVEGAANYRRVAIFPDQEAAGKEDERYVYGTGYVSSICFGCG